MTEGWGGTRPEGYESIEKSVTESDNLTGIEVPPAVSGNAKNGLCEIIKKHETTIASLRKQLEDAREALRPFVNEFHDAGAEHLDDSALWFEVNDAEGNVGLLTVGDFKRAREALKGKS